MGRTGSALDNAVIESWHSTLEFELGRLEHFATKAVARARVAAWIDECNRARKHSACAMRGPITSLSQLDPLRYLSTPGLWLGLLAAAAFLYAAIRLRRSKEPLS